MEQEKEKIIIRQIKEHKSRNLKLVYIPKDSPLEKGDYVQIKKIDLDKLSSET